MYSFSVSKKNLSLHPHETLSLSTTNHICNGICLLFCCMQYVRQINQTYTLYSTVENAQDLFVGSVYTAASELKPEHASSYSQKEITQNFE